MGEWSVWFGKWNDKNEWILDCLQHQEVDPKLGGRVSVVYGLGEWNDKNEWVNQEWYNEKNK